MTEAEWLECNEPIHLLDFLSSTAKLSTRKVRLFACACCRLLPDDVAEVRPGELCLRPYEEMSRDTHQVFDLAEKCAESLFPIDKKELHIHPCNIPLQHLCDFPPAEPIAWLVELIEEIVPHALAVFFCRRRRQVRLLQEIVRNPFRPITLDPACLTPKVKTLVQAIYDDRAFERMPELADALAEAGCSNPDILSHCRGPGPHVRGCWVVDLLLGKE